MARYISTKLFENYSVAIRQWKAQHSHCQLLHGYALKFKVWFASNEPDVENQLCLPFRKPRAIAQQVTGASDKSLLFTPSCASLIAATTRVST